MTLAQLRHRLRAAWTQWAVAIDRKVLEMSMDGLKKVVDSASAAADRIIAKQQGDAAALADANQQIANFETDATAAVQPLVDKLAAADPGVTEPTV